MNKKQLMVACVMVIFFLLGCSSYDKGYDDGYEGASPGIFDKLSSSYKRGYDDGADDAYYFDLGCKDGHNEEWPRYPNDADYMEGYKECR